MRAILPPLFFLGVFISLWFLLNNLQVIMPVDHLLLVVIAAAGILTLSTYGTFRAFLKKTLSQIFSNSYFIPVAMVVLTTTSVAIRILLYMKFSYAPVSDPGILFDSARAISNGESIEKYIPSLVFFPYLSSYSNFISMPMRIFEDPWLATIAVNTVVDILAGYVLYLLVRDASSTKNSKAPLIALALWLLSPFNILFSMQALPIVVVNLFIVLSLYVSHKLFVSIKQEKVISSLVHAVSLGLIMGTGNCFRPVFVIFAIALLIVFVFIVFQRKQARIIALCISSFIIAAGLIYGMQKPFLALVNTQSEVQTPSSYSGWSIYAGANSGTLGQWSELDQQQRTIICADSSNYEECHSRLQQMGIDRYKQLGLLGSMELFIEKLKVFAGNQNNIYNAKTSIVGYEQSNTAKLFNTYIILFISILFALCIRSFLFYFQQTSKGEPILEVILFSILVMCGFFFSSMILETSLRYAQVLYPLFMLFASLGLYQKAYS